MKKHYLIYLALSAVTFVQCSSQKEADPTPAPMGPNTAAVRVDGKVFPVEVATSTAVVYRVTKDLYVTLNTANGSQVIVRLDEFENAPGRFVFTDMTTSSGLSYKEVINGQTGSMSSRACGGTITRTIEITAYDEVNRTVAGTFSGTVCSGGQKVSIEQGRFNLSFTTLQ